MAYRIIDRRGKEEAPVGTEEGEKGYLERSEILKKVAGILKSMVEKQGLEFGYREVRMKDIVTLSRERAAAVKAKREPLIEAGISKLERMLKEGEIAPDFFRDGIAGIAALAEEALETAIKMIREEEKAKEERR